MRPFAPDEEIACRDLGHNRDWWVSEKPEERIQAARLCQGCPVITACYDHGRRHGEVGVWGGVDLGSRARVTKDKS